jgi:hypothetical protein
MTSRRQVSTDDEHEEAEHMTDHTEDAGSSMVDDSPRYGVRFHYDEKTGVPVCPWPLSLSKDYEDMLDGVMSRRFFIKSVVSSALDAFSNSPEKNKKDK